ncbi:MAG: isoprenyl transferase [Candidatus Aminicenantes bacterium]|nr:MAG: isoprenyl transferase [Candidatus Aminicenantes bacterium]
MRPEWDGFVEPGSKEEELLLRIDFDRLPQHVAIIMDGNGRWARQRNLPRVEGHRAGAKSVQEAVETAARLGISYLTLFAFSKENWKRPRKEVNTLWRLLEEYSKKQDKVMLENNLRLKVIGEREGIPPRTRRELERLEKLTAQGERMTILLALNYSGREEIVHACREIVRQNLLRSDEIDEETITKFLYTAGIPDPDLLIRTSGEMRISNFLLWQMAYTELWITPVLWPDFRKIHFLEAVLEYQRRERRFGGLGSN